MLRRITSPRNYSGINGRDLAKPGLRVAAAWRGGGETVREMRMTTAVTSLRCAAVGVPGPASRSVGLIASGIGACVVVPSPRDSEEGGAGGGEECRCDAKPEARGRPAVRGELGAEGVAGGAARIERERQ